MKSYRQQILDYISGWNRSMYAMNTSGAKYYGASFYKRTAWDGSFERDSADLKHYDFVYDLKNQHFIKSYGKMEA